MNGETMNNLLLYLTDIVKQGVEFSIENIPNWITQILAYKVFENTLLLAFSSTFLLITFLIFLKFRKRIRQRIRYDDSAAGFYLLFAVCWFFPIIAIIYSASNLVMINIAPMYYLMKLMGIAI